MKSECFLTLHRQQQNYHSQGPQKGSKDIKLREYFLCAKKTKITLYKNLFSSKLCVPKMNTGLTGLERYEGEKFSFLGELTF